MVRHGHSAPDSHAQAPPEQRGLLVLFVLIERRWRRRRRWRRFLGRWWRRGWRRCFVADGLGLDDCGHGPREQSLEPREFPG
ncbi:MAG TPA: hypothetical protein QGF58_03750 [Myxococcota bacterium]|nr:hypothetical protein [Myxococcota bacterium]